LASYAESSAGLLEFFWEPDPEVLARRVMRIAEYLEDFAPPLAASQKIAIADMKNHFDTETAPDGYAWAPHAESTTLRWGEHKILNLTGALEGAATAPYAFPIDGHDLFFSTAGLPFYGMIQETGRRAAHITEFIAQVGAERIAPGMEFSGGGAPPRPFIGISEEAQDEIIAVFDAWFEGGVSGFYVHGGGTVQGRTSSGQFTKAIG